MAKIWEESTLYINQQQTSLAAIQQFRNMQRVNGVVNPLAISVSSVKLR